MSGNDKATQNEAMKPDAESCAAEGDADPQRDDVVEGALAEDALHLELEKTKADCDEYRQEMLRAKAEVENIRKRAQRDVAAAHRYGLERFIDEFLLVKDSMDLGQAAALESTDVDSLREGIELTLKMFDKAFEKVGVREVDPIGEKFDPDYHQAMTVEESPEAEPGTVLRVVQKGYLLNERLVRPAMVIVAKPVEQTDA